MRGKARIKNILQVTKQCKKGERREEDEMKKDKRVLYQATTKP